MIEGIFYIFFSLVNSTLGDYFLLKTFFSSVNFITKIMPNFWRTDIHRLHCFIFFPSSMLIFAQTFCFLGPTIFEIPQPNGYWCLLLVWCYTIYIFWCILMHQFSKRILFVFELVLSAIFIIKWIIHVFSLLFIIFSSITLP